MSLVDYASSSDEEEEPEPPQKPAAESLVKEDPHREDKRRRTVPAAATSPQNNDPAPAHNTSGNSLISSCNITVRPPGNLRRPPSTQREPVSAQSAEMKLPDASLLLNSPAMPSNLLNASDHSSRVAAAMAESAARKRDLNGSSSSYPRSKIPKGTLPHSKNIPETVGGRLIPPQLQGRSNVVTEDISKLFVKKHTNSSAE